MLKIKSNGSKWYGQEPDSIEILLDVLANHPLNPIFERYGNFVSKPDRLGMVSFFGNFATVSHVFNIDTDEAEIIEKLATAINANRRGDDYRKLKASTRRKRKVA